MHLKVSKPLLHKWLSKLDMLTVANFQPVTPKEFEQVVDPFMFTTNVTQLILRGVRLMLDRMEADDAGMDRALQGAAKSGMPVNVLGWGHLERVAAMASRNPDTQIVLDHLGLKQPFFPPRLEAPWEDLTQVLALAEKPNVAIKITGACTLSAEDFPFADIWDPLARIFDAYGVDRCLWGTDWTRATNLITYNDGVEPFRVTDRLSESDRATLMGGTCARVYGWAPGS